MSRYDYVSFQYEPQPPAPKLPDSSWSGVFLPYDPLTIPEPVKFLVDASGMIEFAPESLPRSAAELLCLDERDIATPWSIGLLLIRPPVLTYCLMVALADQSRPSGALPALPFCHETYVSIVSDPHRWVASLDRDAFAELQDVLRRLLGGPLEQFIKHYADFEFKYQGASSRYAPLFLLYAVDHRILRALGLLPVAGEDRFGDPAFGIVLRRSVQGANAVAGELGIPVRFVAAT